jgi:hypothetical protein
MLLVPEGARRMSIFRVLDPVLGQVERGSALGLLLIRNADKARSGAIDDANGRDIYEPKKQLLGTLDVFEPPPL